MDITQLLEEMNTYINESLKDRINAIIKDEDLPATVIIEKDGKVGVEVDGDWKHEHAYFTNKMGSHGLWPEDHEIVGDGESDCYTAIYYFSESIDESLKDYKEVGKILQNKEDGGFNVAEGNDPLLLKDQPTLKQLLTELAKYM